MVAVLVLSACPSNTGMDGGTGGGVPFFGGGIGGGGGTGGGTTGGGTTGGGTTGGGTTGGGTTGGGTTGGGTTGGGTTGGGTTGGGTTGGGGPSATAFFRLDIGTSYPSVVASNDGVFHIAYATGFSHTVKYGRCAANCGSPASWTFIDVETQTATGSTNNARMAVAADGRLHLVFEKWETGGDFTVYATCATNCTQVASWQKLDVTSLLGPSKGAFRSMPIVVDASGRVSFITNELSTNGSVYLSTCGANCTTLSNWQSGVIRMGGLRIAMAANGTTLHAIVNDEASRLHYRSCASNCSQAASWTESSFLFVHDGTMPTAIAVAPSGRIVLAYNQGYTDPSEPANIQAQANKLLVWQCDSNCTDAMSWSGVILGADRDGEEGIKILELGGAEVVALTNSLELRVGVCASGCTNAANWQFSDVDTTAAMAAAQDPYMVFTCGGSRPGFAAWNPDDGVLAISPTTGEAVFAHAPYGLKTCGVNTTRDVAMLRMVYVP